MLFIPEHLLNCQFWWHWCLCCIAPTLSIIRKWLQLIICVHFLYSQMQVDEQQLVDISFILTAVYLLLGMALIAMCFNLMQVRCLCVVSLSHTYVLSVAYHFPHTIRMMGWTWKAVRTFYSENIIPSFCRNNIVKFDIIFT